MQPLSSYLGSAHFTSYGKLGIDIQHPDGQEVPRHADLVSIPQKVLGATLKGPIKISTTSSWEEAMY